MTHEQVIKILGIIIFDTALVNQGLHYNTSNGKFTAPIAGLYHFSFQAVKRQ